MLKREVKQTNPERSRQPLGGALLSSAVYGNGFPLAFKLTYRLGQGLTSSASRCWPCSIPTECQRSSSRCPRP